MEARQWVHTATGGDDGEKTSEIPYVLLDVDIARHFTPPLATTPTSESRGR